MLLCLPTRVHEVLLPLIVLWPLKSFEYVVGQCRLVVLVLELVVIAHVVMSLQLCLPTLFVPVGIRV